MDTPRTTLCPGYTHVSAFSPSLCSPKSRHKPLEYDPDLYEFEDDDEGYEEETEYIVLDLGNIEPTLVPSSSSYRLIGLDSPTPFLQLSGTILQGRHDNLLGSELIFTDDKDSVGIGQKKRGVTHVATTSKRITFKEVQLRPKQKTPQSSAPVAVESVATDHDADGDKADEDEEMEYYEGEPSANLDPGPSIAMDIDDALEYVDLDAAITSSLDQAGPSRLTTAPSRTPTSEPVVTPTLLAPGPSTKCPAQPAVTPKTTFSSFISEYVEALSPSEKEKISNDRPVIEQQQVEGTDDSIDPALRIDRLTGISPPLTRAPRGLNKVSESPAASGTTASEGTEAIGGSKKGKGKGKQKA